MQRLSLGLAVLASLALASPVRADRTLAQDTMSTATPVAVSCGFCAMEAYGVVFADIGASGGLRPSDFPLNVTSAQLALGSADVVAGACHGLAAGGDTNVHFELWAGTTVPEMDDIHALPVAGMPWPGEDLLVSLDDYPVTMSTPTSDGAVDFNLMLNTLMLGDATTPPPRVDPPHTYLRAVVVLGDGGSSSTCTPTTAAPTGFPLRDDDMVAQDHRSFIYALGAGWLWNEAVGVRGDWGIRLTIEPLRHEDAGPVDAAVIATDAGSTDAGAIDAATPSDAGSDAALIPSGGGATCGCRAGGARELPLSFSLLALVLVVATRRR
jgi:hypothetical protein